MQRYNWGYGPGDPIPEKVTVKLQKGETLGGVVQDEEGRPVRGATVYLWSHNYKKKDPRELLFDLRATTGPDGRWVTSGAPETTGELLGFYVEHPDFLNHRGDYSVDGLPKVADLRAGTAVMVPKRGVPIEGRVLDAKGRPVSGATVASSRDRTQVMRDPSPSTTDAEGRFRTPQVAFNSGDWFVTVFAKGCAPEVKELKIAEESPWVEIVLGVPRAFRGRVVDPDGKPLNGVSIDFEGFQRFGGSDVYFDTDADGRFRWDDAPNERLRVNVQKDGYLVVMDKWVEPSDTETVITIQPAVYVFGKVHDAKTKTMVMATALVEFGPVGPQSGEVVKWSALPRTDWPACSGGELKVGFPVVEHAETYKFRILADGYAPFVSRAFRHDEKRVRDYDVNLTPAP